MKTILLGISLLLLQNTLFSQSLSSVEIGSSHSLYTVFDGNSHFLAASPSLNTLVFIHRSNTFLYGPQENGRYRYDISTDGGKTWITDIGTLNPSSNELGPSGRYPNVVIYNPIGNNDPGNAYLAYAGSYVEPVGSWNGIFTGTAQLNNNPATFKENILSLNNGNVQIFGSMISSAPGIFWAAIFSTRPNTVDPNGILLLKGLWNNTIKDINWTIHKTFNPPLDLTVIPAGKLTDVAIDFDPTGQYGWLVFTGDITPGSPHGSVLYTPNFYATQDGGDTWMGPMVLELPNFKNLLFDRLLADSLPQPTDDMDIAVDAYGNPHLLLSIGRQQNFTYGWWFFEHDLYAFHFDFSAPQGCRWKATLIDTLNGASGRIMQDNRPQISKSADGTKLFFTWVDSDWPVAGNTNDFPNLYSRGYDINTGMVTPIKNWTGGTPQWSNKAYYSTPSPVCFDSNGTYTIPMVAAAGDSIVDTINFHYLRNIQHTNTEFNVTPFEICDPTAPTFQILTGIVADQSGQIIDSGRVILYDVSDPINGFDTVDIVYIDNFGRYQFNNVFPGEIIIKVIPDPGRYPDLASAYLRNVVLWNGSDTVTIWDNQPDTIFCPAKPSLAGGSNILKGYVILNGANKRAEPIEEEDIIITKVPPGTPSAITRTDEFGYFEVSGLEQGNYEIFVDHPGIPMFEANSVVFASDSNTVGVSAYVDSALITLEFDSTVTNVVKHLSPQLSIFPNPVTNKIWLSFNLPVVENISVSIFNTTGEVEKTFEIMGQQGKNMLEINLADLSNGIYIVQFNSVHYLHSEKVFKMSN